MARAVRLWAPCGTRLALSGGPLSSGAPHPGSLMSKFDLRDVSDRLTGSRDTKAVVFEFLRSLEAARGDWRASLAFYEVSRDAFVDVFEVEGNRLIRREIVVRADELPERLVRKLFDASAIFNA